MSFGKKDPRELSRILVEPHFENSLKVPEIYSRENWDTLASASHPE
jgi:hypothetical protein